MAAARAIIRHVVSVVMKLAYQVVVHHFHRGLIVGSIVPGTDIIPRELVFAGLCHQPSGFTSLLLRYHVKMYTSSAEKKVDGPMIGTDVGIIFRVPKLPNSVTDDPDSLDSSLPVSGQDLISWVGHTLILVV